MWIRNILVISWIINEKLWYDLVKKKKKVVVVCIYGWMFFFIYGFIYFEFD